MKVFANYEKERAAFRGLLEPQCRQRIVMYRGESGSGKTSLMTACQTLVPNEMCHVAMDLRGTATTVTEILSRTVVKLGGLGKLRHLTARLAALSRVPALNLADNTLRGTQNQIEVVVQNTAPVDRRERYEQLTDAWFADLAEAEQPLLLILENFDQANEDVHDWICGPFLARAAETVALRVALTGKRVPESRIDWARCCQVFDLYGVKEAEHWLPVVEALGYRVPMEPPLTYLAAICHALNGHPAQIIQIIKTFPRKH
jgi:hypothetical protein